MKQLIWLVALVVALCCVCPVQADELDSNDVGLRVWAMTGINPEFGKTQELRVGCEGFLADTEFAIGGVHANAPDVGIEQWSLRTYAIAHAIDANMVAQALNKSFAIPEGDIYGGLFGQYSFDRDKEWSGGYVVGGLVSWPRGWQTVAEYQALIFNSEDNDYAFVVGLRRSF